MIKKILFLTGNTGKAREMKALLNLEEIIFDFKKLDVHEIQSMDLLEIGKIKTEMAMQYQETEEYDAVLTDDVGLYLDELNGFPGPLIKWYLESLGIKGILNHLKSIPSPTTAKCVLSLGLTKTGEILQFTGEVKGKLVKPQGDSGFGWDPIFKPEGKEQTYALMDEDEKNKISHRTLAVNKMKEWLVK